MKSIEDRQTVIHLIPNPLSGLRFVDPIVKELSVAGFDAELWTEPGIGTDRFVAKIGARKRLAYFNIVVNPIAIIWRGLSLWRQFLIIRPRCVHAHQTRGGVIPLVAARMANVPIRIYHNHGSAYWGTSWI